MRGPDISCFGAPPAVSTSQIVDRGHLLSDLNESPTTKATFDPSGEICVSSTFLNDRTSSGFSCRLAADRFLCSLSFDLFGRVMDLFR